MQVTETSVDGLKRGFKVVVAAEDIDSKVQSRLTEVGRGARIPGFRPGKVPMRILKSRFGPSVMAEVLEGTVRDSSAKLLEERGLKPATQPQIEVKTFDEGKDLEFDMSVELLPEFQIADLAAIELERIKVEASDAEVREALERLATQHRKSEKVTEDREARQGDIVVIDYLGRIEGEAFEGGSGTGVPLELGAGGFIPGFEDQLVGAKAGASVEIAVTFPEDYAAPVAGKEARFSCDIKELREPIPIQVDAEFARTLGMDGLEGLESAMREQLNREYAFNTRARLKRQLLDRLEELHKFDVPPGMLEAEFAAIWAQVDEARKQNRLDPEDADKSEDELKSVYRSIAERRVRLGLVLSAIGEKNGITVDREELNRAVMAEARSHVGHEQKVIDYYNNNMEALATLRAPIFEDKVVNYIFGVAKVNERTISGSELVNLPDEEPSPPAGGTARQAEKAD